MEKELTFLRKDFFSSSFLFLGPHWIFVMVRVLVVECGLFYLVVRASLVVDVGSRVHGLTSCGMQALECAAL